MSSAVAAGLGFAGNLIGASQANKAAKQQADAQRQAAERESAQLRELAAPYMQESQYAMPQFRSLIESQYAPVVGKDNPYLSAQHQINLGNIRSQRNASLARSNTYWGSMGDLGRSRGEALRIGQNTVDSMNRENLGYGTGQQDYRNQSADRFANALSALYRMAAPGLDLMKGAAGTEADGTANAANIRAAGQQKFWNTMGGAFGNAVNAMKKKTSP